MDGCNKCREIDTLSLTYESLQVLPWHNNTIIEKINGSNSRWTSDVLLTSNRRLYEVRTSYRRPLTSKGHLMPTGNRCRQIRDFIQYRHFWNQWDVIIIDYDISLQQLLLCKNIVNSKECEAEIVKFYNRKRIIHQMGGYNWNCELTQYLSNTCQIHFIYATHGSK